MQSRILSQVGYSTECRGCPPEPILHHYLQRYADGWSMEDIQTLRESLLPHARLVAEQVSAQWVMDACREDMAGSVRRGDIA